jgi:hypothetical protein
MIVVTINFHGRSEACESASGMKSTKSSEYRKLTHEHTNLHGSKIIFIHYLVVVQ